MVIDMNEARLDTIEQIREFLAGTADVVFSTTEDQATRHRFVATVLRRHRYFKPARAIAGSVRLHAAADRLHPTAPDQAGRPLSAGAALAPAYAGQPDQKWSRKSEQRYKWKLRA